MLTSPLEIINRLYPKARITSGYRSPNHPLSRANPSSAHMHGTPDNPGAVDVAPIPGVQFADYVASLKQQGLPVSGARDEAAHPMPWTTGPNWHVSLLGQRQVAAAPKKSRTLADIAKPSMEQAPVGLMAVGTATAPTTLADLQLPGGDIHKTPAAFGKGGMGWKILGVLGDSYLEANGKPGNYVPQLLEQRRLDDLQRQRDDQFAQQLELQRQKALMPRPPTQTQQFVNEILDPKTPPQRKALIRAILTRPIIGTITNSDGSQYQTQSYPGDSSEDDWENM